MLSAETMTLICQTILVQFTTEGLGLLSVCAFSSYLGYLLITVGRSDEIVRFGIACWKRAQSLHASQFWFLAVNTLLDRIWSLADMQCGRTSLCVLDPMDFAILLFIPYVSN